MSLRDQYLVVHGRKPVLEALKAGYEIGMIHLSSRASGGVINTIEEVARTRGVKVEHVSENRINALTRSGQHQGVAADVRAHRMQSLPSFLEQRTGRNYGTAVLVLDGIHNPANLGMILRSATAAGITGVVVPDEGTASVGAVAIKASAGVAFKAPILRIDNALNAVTQLIEKRFEAIAVDAEGETIFTAEFSDRVALVFGNETVGITPEIRGLCSRTVSLPLHNGVESLNVAMAASIISYEITSRQTARETRA
jgi:23S rRNA (guanosine2251-2'-O)-methyltransferase